METAEAARALVRGAVRRMKGYVPGLQPGPGQELVKLNTNENPFPPSAAVLEALHSAVSGTLRLYPNPEAAPLREAAARRYGLQPAQVMCGNGSDEILSLLMKVFIGEGETIAYFEPSYSLYPVLAEIASAHTRTVALPRVSRPSEMAALPVPDLSAKLFFLATPNAPYGPAFNTAWVGELLQRFQGIVVADEAYVDFADESSLPILQANPRLVIVRTLSKAYSLAGMRAGLAFAHPRIIEEMMKVKDSYNVSRLAQVAAVAALDDDIYFRTNRDRLVATRQRFSGELAALGFTVLPSGANFVFVVPPQGLPAGMVYEALLGRGFLVRWWKSGIVSDGLRISIGTDADMDGLVGALGDIQRAG